MLSTVFRRTMATGRHFIAVCQMTSDNDLEKNFQAAKNMIERAGEKKCEMVFLPECFDFIGLNKNEQIDLAMATDCEYMEKYRELARKHNIWLSLGGLHHKDPSDAAHPWNTHLIIDSDGVTRAEYNKLHLFDLEIPGKVRLMESEFSKAGTEMIPPVDTPIGRLGLSICYDVRFPELSLWNRKRGAQLLSFPSAFTLNTGLAHWETLLRARAIENQCYVVAAAQTGAHNPKRQSYGHSMVVDPWGAVVAQCSERVDMCFAEIDLSYVDTLREMQPVFSHRRSDLYTLHINEKSSETGGLKFARFNIPADHIFYSTPHSFVFVNLKPVTDGHVLVSPKRVVPRLTDLTDAETADLFIVAKKVQAMLEKHHNVTSTTICVQDGKDAGQTVPHVHIHILPRRAGDFGDNEIYQKLASHDKEPERKPRSNEQMAEEAVVYRNLM
ncbi:Nitrilase homolog [Caenorhabditis elegans]|uniref:Nitrilase and fragile histidine triad fusion protein NitFhit n=1 Tax=Caenorhabditis elegans TaxID=6239 RepID=NFT1_CAEEL|nr:Nitrilase homolog [Caenorhabditis elegans]O76463.1 RecName: Full=Nitrilase and fragile histidine triad fusion protein NitFhit; Includes: RecName: Full=Bis(5'-adenosyl)-triphosphatase; AltName: Full=AP3A hydrolase; Short=AP3Aase; AltName: Full=Diadenosine 5',5'''-P1,P3-triphosphate hydrolase; AltName: Full=Dinucleosidetriphosphatase; Includes: RecName: Full=Nitrilase homolog [Caenorhabditis elegans]1EMS_A Chain A, Nit-fragile Histidine Triad Fusion Protein [Caenorhabditis elegans]1EMS_B Chain |eukprot:NP_499556.1 Nitrilase homolog [Caenorhabditis elegans]